MFLLFLFLFVTFGSFFQVRAKNGAGWGEWSDILKAASVIGK